MQNKRKGPEVFQFPFRCPGDATDMHVAATRLLEIWRRFVVAHIFTGDV
jgi:hypothetical protein